MKESVSVIFTTEQSVYFIKRQNYLSVFPGYFSTPGGKIDSLDSDVLLAGAIWPKMVRPQIIHALIREINEECNFDLLSAVFLGQVLSIDYLGFAITPEFNPYHFKNYYFKILLKDEIDFLIDQNEAEYGGWSNPDQLLKKYYRGEILAVPPTVKIIKKLCENLNFKEIINFDLSYDHENEVPMIESLFGVRQFLPLSNTFPPANRTNSFIIGDGIDHSSKKILIDPSPKNQAELQKFINSISKIGFDSIFITHHHLDHYEKALVIARIFKVGIELSLDTFKRIKNDQGDDYFAGVAVTFRKEGDIITKSLGEEVRVYEVPGHDEGQLALAPLSLNWFLVGDLIQTIGTVLIKAPEGDMSKYFKTLQQIIDLKPKNCIPSHGIIVGGVDKLQETLNHRKMREEQILKLQKEGKQINEMLALIYPKLEENLIPYALKTIAAHLQKLQQENIFWP